MILLSKESALLLKSIFNKRLYLYYNHLKLMDILILTFFGGLAGFLKFYLVLLTIRIYITWFPNFNMYSQPLYSLGKLTDPYLKIFRGLIPSFFGIDLSPLLGFLFLNFSIDFFSSISSIGK